MKARWINRCLGCLAMALGVTFGGSCAMGAGKPASHDALYMELARRGLNDLLDRAFAEDHVPKQKQDAIRDAAALERLGDPHLTSEQRDALLATAVKGVDGFVAGNPDSGTLNPIAHALSEAAVTPAITEMELWGGTADERAKLRPVVEAAVKIYTKLSTVTKKEADDAANAITSPNDQKHIDAYNAAEMAHERAVAKVALMKFSQALVMEPSDEKRSRLITDTLNMYTSWDDPSTGFAAYAEYYMARLHGLIFSDANELQMARKGLGVLIDGKPATTPPAPQSLRFQAAIFQILIDLDASDSDSAGKDLDAAKAFESANAPAADPNAPNPKAAADAAAADAKDQAGTLILMDYRIQAYLADKSLPGAAQDKYNAAATNDLGILLKNYPALQAIILKHIAMRLPANPDLTKLDPVLLEALVSQGRVIVSAALPDPKNVATADLPTLQRARDAAVELISRYNQKRLSKEDAMQPSFLEGMFDEYMGNSADAANALIDYVVEFGGEKNNNAPAALDEARSLIGDLYKTRASGDPTVTGLLTRFLPVAIGEPYNEKQLAPQYAALLLDKGDWSDAITYYRMVPDSATPAKQLSARYGELYCLSNILDSDAKLTADDRKQYVAQIQDLADKIGKIAQDDHDPKDRLHAQSTLANIRLIAARLAYHEQHDYDRVLSLLDGYEDSVKGIPDSQTMINAALYMRVYAYMLKGDMHKATDTLMEFLGGISAEERAQVIHDLLDRINKDMDLAQGQLDEALFRGDAALARTLGDQLRELSGDCATLSDSLVKNTQNNPDPKVSENLYIYMRFDASAHRRAAEFMEDPDARQKAMQQALGLYKDLQSDDNVAAYHIVYPTSKTPDDPIVSYGIALCEYDVADWKDARDDLLKMINSGNLGVNNGDFWEAYYKWLESMQHLVDAKDADTHEAEVVKQLKNLYLTYVNETGGEKWKVKFMELRKQIMPDWVNPAEKLAAQGSATTQPSAATQPSPATQPSAEAK